MSAKFVAASSQRLVNSTTPITTMPFSVGYWVYVGVQDSQAHWGIFDTGGASNYYRFLHTVTGTWQIAASDGTTAFQNFGSITVGAWHYVVVRMINATNKRAAVLSSNGAVDHGTTSTAATPASLDNMALGSIENSSPGTFLDGNIAEFWCANVDIQPDGGQLDETLLRQLAYGGPFSVPHIAKDIIEYRSFRKYPSSDGDEIGEVFHGALGRQTWINTNGVTIGPHPPLPYWYAKPGQVQTELVI